jgi:regulator of sigma E protease
MNWLYILLGFSLLIILHEGGHYLAAKATGMRVERFFLFFGPTLWSFKRGETEYGIKSIPLGGYVKITGMNPEEEIAEEIADRAYYRQPVWKRIVVIAAGPAVNIVLAFLIFFFVFWTSAQRTNETVGEVLPNTPAAAAGLQSGDRVVAVDGRSFAGAGLTERLEGFTRQVAAHDCAGGNRDGCTAATPADLTIERDGERRTVEVRPEYDVAAKRALVGFRYGTEPVDIGVGGSATESLDRMWLVVSRTGEIFSRIFESEQRKQISGIVGVSDAANQTIDEDALLAVVLLGLVSLSLGIINLLPFLPLDGGHIFWSLVEKVRGRPVSLRVMERATVVGFALVAVLFFIGLSNDVGRIGTDAYRAP